MKKHWFQKNLSLQFVLAVSLFAATAYLASHEALSSLEESIFNGLYDQPHILRPFALLITQAGSVYVLMVLAMIYFFKKHYHIVIRILMSGTFAYLLAGVAKDLYGRPRPADLLNDIVVRDFYVRGPGFPSGHAALATAMGLTLARYLPRKYVWMVPVGILLVCWSRIYLGAHAPLDVVGGFALGWVSVLLFRTVRLLDLRRNPQTKKPKSLKKRP